MALHYAHVQKRVLASYTACGVALAVLAGASLTLAVAASPDSTRIPAAAPAPAVSQVAAPSAVHLPADDVIAGSAESIIRKAGLSSAVSPLNRSVAVCAEPVAGWVRSESAHTATGSAGVTVQVAAWRAGAAAAALNGLRDLAAQCGSIAVEEPDGFQAASDLAGVRRGVGARRFGDVVVVATAVQLPDAPDDVVAAVLDSSESVLIPRMRGICPEVDQESNSAPARDPYADDYNGFRLPVTTLVPDAAALTQSQVSAVTGQVPSPTWRPPAAKPFPELAPAIRYDAAGAPIGFGKPPMLIDPDEMDPPAGPESGSPGPAPEPPRPGPGEATAHVRATDTVGPGCGWAFAGTVSPQPDPADTPENRRAQIVRELLVTTRAQGEAMVDAIQWPAKYQRWFAEAQTAADWKAYWSAKADAEAALEEAQEEYEDSLERGRRPKPAPSTSYSDSPQPQPPGPAPVPDGSGSAQPGPEPAPDGSPTEDVNP